MDSPYPTYEELLGVVRVLTFATWIGWGLLLGLLLNAGLNRYFFKGGR